MSWYSGIQSAGVRAATLIRNGNEFSLIHPNQGTPLPGSSFSWSTSASLYGTSASPQGYYFTTFSNPYYSPPFVGTFDVTANFTDVCGCSSTIYQTYQDRGSFEYVCFPIPVSDRLTIAYLGEIDATTRGNVEVRLYNDRQELVLRQTMRSGEAQTTIDVSGLPDGNYFLDIVKNNQVAERHTIVVKH